MNRSTAPIVTLAAIGLAVLTGCSAGSSSSQPRVPSPGQSHTGVNSEQRGSDASWTKSYGTVEAVKADSREVVVGHIEKARETVKATEDGTGELKSTIFHIRVDQVLSGSLTVGGIIKVRQMGTKESPAFSNDDLSLLEDGQSYMLFLQPFEFHRGVNTGQFQIVGEVGAFKIQGQTAVRTTKRDKLPTNLPLSTVVGAAQKK